MTTTTTTTTTITAAAIGVRCNTDSKMHRHHSSNRKAGERNRKGCTAAPAPHTAKRPSVLVVLFATCSAPSLPRTRLSACYLKWFPPACLPAGP